MSYILMSNKLNNDRCINAFWELVRCGLTGDVPKDELFSELDDEMWEEVYRHVKVQAVIGICYQAVQALSKKYQPSWPLLLKWHVHTDYIIAANKKQRKVWFEMNRRFKETGISPLLMKGISIAAYYPSPLHRCTGDLDVYVKEFDKAVQVVENWGLDVKHGVWHNQFVYDGVDVELHHTYWGQDKKSDNCFMEIKDPEGDYMVLDEFANARLQIEHVIHHLLEGGVGVRHLCDWAVFVAKCRQNLDIEKLENYFKKKKLDVFVRVFSALAAERLGSGFSLQLPEMHIKDKQKYIQLLEQDMLEYGNFGKGNPEINRSGFKRLAVSEKWAVVRRRITRAWSFRGLCPVYVLKYIWSMLVYVCRSIVTGRAFSHAINEK